LWVFFVVSCFRGVMFFVSSRLRGDLFRAFVAVFFVPSRLRGDLFRAFVA